MDEPAVFLAAARRAGATAILAYYHHLAVRLCHAAVQLGLRVPDDISIACFNDVFGLDALNPPLTAVSLPYFPAGRAAAKLLMRLVAGEVPEQRQIVFPERLVIRDSTGPAAVARARRRRKSEARAAGT